MSYGNQKQMKSTYFDTTNGNLYRADFEQLCAPYFLAMAFQSVGKHKDSSEWLQLAKMRVTALRQSPRDWKLKQIADMLDAEATKFVQPDRDQPPAR